ncbi:MAG: hypothetical protein ACOYL3_01520 [Desulfuromonadaceae bacterium]
MRPHTITFKNICYTALACLLLAGCATDTTCKYIAKEPIFFPPAPDEPRIQYLTGINSSDDVGGDKKKGGGLALMVTGKDQSDGTTTLGKAYGIEIHKGKIYIAEGMERRISIIDLAKGTFTEPPGTKTLRGALSYPLNLTLDDNDNLYVADPSRHEIVVYDAQGNFKTSYGKKLGPKSKITDVKFYKGKFYALDMGLHMLRLLDPTTGEPLGEFGNTGKPEDILALPGNFTIDADGNFYITNLGSNKVIKLDQDGNYLDSFGGVGDQFGKFSKPKGIAIDNDRQIYVVDGGTNIVQLFNDKFRTLTYFGWPGLNWGSLNSPTGIAISTEHIDYFQKFAAPGFKVTHLIYVVSQFGQEFCIPRITVYGFGQMEKK